MVQVSSLMVMLFCLVSKLSDDIDLKNITVVAGSSVSEESSSSIHAGGLVGLEHSTYLIEAGAQALFKAATEIRLGPGFHAERGSSFHAFIEPHAEAPLSFTPLFNGVAGMLHSSNTVVLSHGPATLSVSGGADSRIVRNGVDTGLTSVQVSVGDLIAIKSRSPASAGVSSEVTVTLNDKTTTWRLSSGALVTLDPPSGSLAGYTQGSFVVMPDGSASYRIPLSLPKGSPGILPDLALSYNSFAGNGLIGRGWVLDGLSVLTWRGCQLERDSLEMDRHPLDRFYLDGEPLLSVSGEYADASEYRCETNSFSRVTAHGRVGNGPRSFRVETRDGLSLEYGSRPDARITGEGHEGTSIWAVNRITDTLGNYLTITYAEKGLFLRPTRIDYSGNETMGLDPYASVVFEYEARREVLTQTLAGCTARLDLRLKDISCYDGSRLFRKYRLSYAAGPDSLLTEIVECGALGNCYSPTLLSYNTSHAERTSIQEDLACDSVVSKLVAIDEGHGPRIRIVYKPLSDTSVYLSKSPITPDALHGFMAAGYVVAELDHSGSSDSDDGLRTYYNYESGFLGLYSPGFRGFEHIETRNAFTGKTSRRTFYKPSQHYAGISLLRVADYSTDKELLNETVHRVAVYEEVPGSYFPYSAETRNYSYGLEGEVISSSSVSQQIDAFGNPTQVVIDHGGGYGERIFNAFTNDTERWLLGRLVRTETHRSSPNDDVSKRAITYSYHATSGLLSGETIEPNLAASRLEKSIMRDGFGNIISSSLSALNQVTRTSTTSFDPTGRYTRALTNALGHRETRSYELGNLVSQTDINGLNVRRVYDGFGRLLEEIRADGGSTRMAYIKAEPEALPKSSWYLWRHVSGTGPQTFFYDRLNREIRRQTMGFEGQLVMEDTEYNQLGQVTAVSEPFQNASKREWTTRSYDLRGRIVLEIKPGNRITEWAYQGLITFITNPAGQQCTHIHNRLGHLIESLDDHGNRSGYAYDSAGNLIAHTDALGNQTLLRYDVRGNCIEKQDRDSEPTNFEYNAFGELTFALDAMGHQRFFSYDPLGRLIKRSEPEGTAFWVYDQAEMGLGALTTAIESNRFTLQIRYDQFGRPDESLTRIKGKAHILTKAFDVHGHLSTLTYPSGLAVRYAYGSYGHELSVHRVKNDSLIWQAERVGDQGQLTSFSYGNGVVTHRRYHPQSGQLASILAGKIDAKPIQDMQFFYDSMGNLSERQDLHNGLNDHFEYDSLNRLIRVSSMKNDITLSYDSLSKIQSKSDTGEYAKNGAGPQALTPISGPWANSFSYDVLGNRTNDKDCSSFNKPAMIVADGSSVQLAYDPDQVVYQQSHDQDGLSVTLTRVGTYYEEEQGQSLIRRHFIKADGEVVAVSAMVGQDWEKTRYLHKDYQGWLHTLTDDNGVVLEVCSFDARNNRRAGNAVVRANPLTGIDPAFIGTQHLQAVGLILLDGRVYDLSLSCFLSTAHFED